MNDLLYLLRTIIMHYDYYYVYFIYISFIYIIIITMYTNLVRSRYEEFAHSYIYPCNLLEEFGGAIL